MSATRVPSVAARPSRTGDALKMRMGDPSRKQPAEASPQTVKSISHAPPSSRTWYVFKARLLRSKPLLSFTEDSITALRMFRSFSCHSSTSFHRKGGRDAYRAAGSFEACILVTI
jgi:hypothetical protein